MEIDLTNGNQLVYVIPNTMLTIADFYRNIQVSILTRGYEIGRLSNTPNVGFAYEVRNVVDYLASHGVQALPGRSYRTRNPARVSTSNLLDGSISIHFDNYHAAATIDDPKYNFKDNEVDSDEDEAKLQTLVVIINEPEQKLLVKKLWSSAVLPSRKMPGAAGYDLAIHRAQDIPKWSRALLNTSICIKIPQGTYARIAPRSSASFQKGILIGGGVIDADYIGEKGKCIAQLLFEYIATPEVMEVENIDET
ncbi:deoxyuridine 5'-triphosphate nucleotidohydrolase-like [Zingiber officinale]|uniref:deoxyuridine 5'-triphosphate nucleotidohydrolase-like n=1 Tax=Zingiber officinale TaxID=94328 RepID=UPI001C4AAADC|nr:deoxyuridine 5'-triphosphate nucleotidohydrolase-like [Zingiber officinale]